MLLTDKEYLGNTGNNRSKKSRVFLSFQEVYTHVPSFPGHTCEVFLTLFSVSLCVYMWSRKKYRLLNTAYSAASVKVFPPTLRDGFPPNHPFPGQPHPFRRSLIRGMCRPFPRAFSYWS